MGIHAEQSGHEVLGRELVELLHYFAGCLGVGVEVEFKNGT